MYNSGMNTNQNDKIAVRPYGNGDYGQIKQILKEGGLFYEPMDSQARIDEKILKDPRSIFMATRADEVIGTVSLMEDGRMAFVFRLCVKKEARNAGVGIMLMAHAEKELFSRGYTEVNILVEEGNTQLLEYYVKQGFEKGNLYRWMTKERK